MRNSFYTAIFIALAVAGYFAFSMTFRNGGDASADANAPDDLADDVFAVRTAVFNAEPWRDAVSLRGRTEALRKVTVRSEVEGVIEATPVEPGVEVAAGETLCRIAVDARQANLDQAKATLAQREAEFQASEDLASKGHRAETARLAARAARDQAAAGLEQAKLQLAKTEIRAPFDGVFDRRDVEVGDFVRIGDACGVVVQQSPFLVVGQVSEQLVGRVQPGNPGVAELVTGERHEGVVRVVGTLAEEETRTFRVELEIENEDRTLRDGVTADLYIGSESGRAHLLPRSTLTLNDRGELGVRAVNAEGIVSFYPVEVLRDSSDGIWVSGLPDTVEIITLGQEYVRAGQTVQVEPSGA